MDSNTTPFVKAGNWDSLKCGLLAGEHLHHDLKRMEGAYLERNRRELEITKHVSLRQLAPRALIDLRTTGNCEFDIPEWLFGLDFSNHYFRRIKSVSVSLPCVVGQFTSLNGTLTLLKSTVRVKPQLVSGAADDTNLSVSHLPTQSIATSSGQNDSGMFEFSFRDERYLPFEGAGAISTWRFTLPSEFRAFDYESISDLILHVKYTARDGGDSLSKAATAAIKERLSLSAALTENLSFPVLLSCRSDFPSEWARARTGTNSDLEIPITRSLLPYWLSVVKTTSNTLLDVRKVKFARLTKNQTSPVSFTDVAIANWPIIRNGVTFAKIESVDSNITDVIVLLEVGK